MEDIEQNIQQLEKNKRIDIWPHRDFCPINQIKKSLEFGLLEDHCGIPFTSSFVKSSNKKEFCSDDVEYVSFNRFELGKELIFKDFEETFWM